MDLSPVTTHSPSASKWVIGAIIGVMALLAGYMALGMPGMDHTAAQHEMATMPNMTDRAATPPALVGLTPEQFAGRLADRSSFVINVHTPYDGELDGTDAFITFDTIADSAQRPAAKDREILLYCRSGRMSAIAGQTLIDLGYTNVSHLSGGMNAWVAAGRPLASR